MGEEAGEVIEIIVEEIVEEEEETKIKTKLKLGLSPNIRGLSTLTCHQGSGWGVGSIISTDRTRTFVRNQRHALGRM